MSGSEGNSSGNVFKHRSPKSRQKMGYQRHRKTGNKPKLSSLICQRKQRSQNAAEEMLEQEFAQLTVDSVEKMSNETGITYDLRMIEHKCLWDLNYPEKPERFSMPLNRCKEYGLIDRCTFVPCRPASEDEVLTMHTQELHDILKGTKDVVNNNKLEKLSSRYDAIYFNQSTYDLALLSAGGTIDLMEKIVKGKLKNGMAIIRPPGHHAMENEFCGYCYFNNVAIAAKHAIDNLAVKRVLIVDWDVHHGQATQSMFYNDPRVLYFSIHRYEHGDFWPNLRESNFDFIGNGAGKGFNFNVPLNKTGLGNAEYLAIFHQLLLPVAYEGCMEVTPACYAHLVTQLMQLANGKVCVVLEGGYCIKSLSEGVALTLRALLGDPCPTLGRIGEPDPSAVDSILNVIYVHRRLWKCFRYQGVIYQNEDESPADTKKRRYVPEIKFLGSVDKPTSFATRDCYPVQSKEEIVNFDKRIDDLIKATPLKVPSKRCCLAYDEKMLAHKNDTESGHPEKPDRLLVIYNLLKELKLLEQCHMLPSRMANETEITNVHTKVYLDAMENSQKMEKKELYNYQETFQSIYLCKESFESARISVGCLLQVLDEVLTGKAVSGFALIRPPGHHAETESACGFCIFNNVAIAAKVAKEQYGLERILIVDWDVHHGNGIQHVFENDPKVLYISLHRYDKGTFFPCSEDANFDKTGTNEGAGFNINIPWNKGGMNDGDYISAFLQIILPIAYQFDPQLVLVSAGFDAARGDPLGGCNLSPELYAHLTHLLSCLAGGRVILALEGGYNLYVLASSVLSCIQSLIGEPCPKLSRGIHPNSSAVTSILNVVHVFKKYWSCLKYEVDLPYLPLDLQNREDSPSDQSSASDHLCLESNSNTSIDSVVFTPQDTASNLIKRNNENNSM